MARRIYASANPSRSFAHLQPMTSEDARFWQLRRARAELKGKNHDR